MYKVDQQAERTWKAIHNRELREERKQNEFAKEKEQLAARHKYWEDLLGSQESQIKALEDFKTSLTTCVNNVTSIKSMDPTHDDIDLFTATDISQNTNYLPPTLSINNVDVKELDALGLSNESLGN